MARTMHRTEADLRAALTTLTERWHEYANYCDKAAARTTNGTLGEIRRERATQIRRAARDLEDVLGSGRIPRDLMTTAELEQYGAHDEEPAS